MKYATLALIGAGLVFTSTMAGGQAPPQGATELKDVKQKVAYGIGVDIGKKIKSQQVDFDLDLVAKGIKDGYGGKVAIPDEQIMEAMQTFQQQMMAKAAEAAKGVGEKNLKEGEAFLAANKTKPGVKTTASGLQYKVLKSGTGKTPKATDVVSTHYRGTLIDGTEFDSSYKRNEPTEFPVNGVIQGWTEALQLMKVGDKWQLFIPGNLAYGANPRPGGPIGPNATLLFEIELLEVK
ncbi:FKBP-type peptidyl-prolyl cis-trans isomerase [Tundrisphaera sp. TA3]|uniref:FKBP-type peptidyl-prolyl cis-trans isomerase n=1 Tax=Tundrisphaera sp. TA3 TaxID=3435775 RepID=UPI003EB8175D